MIFQSHDSSSEPIQEILTVAIWLLVMIVALVLLHKKKLTKTASIILLSITFIVSGIIFGALPNPVFPFQNMAIGIHMSKPFLQILRSLNIVTILLVTTFLFGRIFCGFACPLGAIQELVSKFQFKSNLKGRKDKKILTLNEKIAFYIRIGYFVIFMGAGIIWGLAALQYLNVFIGFQIFQNPSFPLIGIPAILLAIIIISSIFIYRPWCRLFCPFGTVADLTSRFSLFKLRRTDDCNDCGLCEKICPTQEAARDSNKSECYFCNRCVDICPQNAIELKRK
ncbi:MAG: 4Fe-4S binding protein [Promethearchaeota archaeon]